jgi:DNA replication and repair protein RecF
LRSYLHALRQRNAALKAASHGSLGTADLDVWTTTLCSHAEAVSARREAYLAALTPTIQECADQIAPGMTVEIHYRRGWSHDLQLSKVLGDSVPREVKSGVTQSGPHRADVELRVAGLPAGASLSRGQGKALASAMMLAQARYLRQDAARSSVFLIDDIGAELDLPHSRRFFGLLSMLGAQILATSNTGPEALRDLPDIQLKAFHVEHGRVAPGQPDDAPEQRG